MSLNHLVDEDLPFPLPVYLSAQTGLTLSNPAMTGSATSSVTNNSKCGVNSYSSLNPISDEATLTMINSHIVPNSVLVWEMSAQSGMSSARVVKEKYTAATGTVDFTVVNTASSQSPTGASLSVAYNILS